MTNMFSNFRTRFNTLTRGRQDDGNTAEEPQHKPDRHQYDRPVFLELTQTELKACLDFTVRPVVVPKRPTALPWKSGYAECTSDSKKRNEDQAAVGEVKLDHQLTAEQQEDLKSTTEGDVSVAHLRGIYFGVFDGHGGEGAALMVADQLINHIQEMLVNVQKEIFELALTQRERRADQKPASAHETESEGKGDEGQGSPLPTPHSDCPSQLDCSGECKLKPSGIVLDDLIVGALEAAFRAMDEQIGREKATFNIHGGCCTIVALFLCGKVYVANAGDCRAVAYTGDEIMPLSTDFKADQDSERIYNMAYYRPDLLGNVFTMDRHIKPTQSEIASGHKRHWCKTPMSSGWIPKLDSEDCTGLLQLITGKGRRSRIMHTVGICRSLGDHDLCFESVRPSAKIPIKPFISCMPEVKILDLRDRTISDEDVLVMGSDGLWDVMTNTEAAEVIQSSLKEENCEEDHRYGKLARKLVDHVKGSSQPDYRGWRLATGNDASVDDITCMVVPLHQVDCSTNITFSYGQVISDPLSSASDSSLS